MRYILTAGWEDGVADLTKRLVHELAAGKRVLWLLSGGSNIPVSVQIMGKISPDLQQQLTITLADERYGPPDHAESNWRQLLQAGFRAAQATLLPVLTAGLNLEATIDHYNQLIERAFGDHEVVIAQLGIGEEGSIAGIRPNTTATANTDALVIGYVHPPFTRLTLTFKGLSRINAAYAFAFGKPKQHTLKLLKTRSLPLAKQPAQILKQLPEAYLYSDQFGSLS